MKKFFAGGLAALVALVAWSSPGSTGDKIFKSVTPSEALKMIEERGDLLLIDVRSPEEYSQGALPGSTLIPFGKVMAGKHDLPKDKPILLVCAVGGRSYTAGKYLSWNGYSEIYNLSGGLSAWAQQRVPLPRRQAAAVAK